VWVGAGVVVAPGTWTMRPGADALEIPRPARVTSKSRMATLNPGRSQPPSRTSAAAAPAFRAPVFDGAAGEPRHVCIRANSAAQADRPASQAVCQAAPAATSQRAVRTRGKRAATRLMKLRLSSPKSGDQVCVYTMVTATMTSSARLKATASVHSASEFSRRSRRTSARPGHTSRNQKTMGGRSGPAMGVNVTMAAARAEVTMTIGHSQGGAERLGESDEDGFNFIPKSIPISPRLSAISDPILRQVERKVCKTKNDLLHAETYKLNRIWPIAYKRKTN
jgi:hypothetical protein